MPVPILSSVNVLPAWFELANCPENVKLLLSKPTRAVAPVPLRLAKSPVPVTDPSTALVAFRSSAPLAPRAICEKREAPFAAPMLKIPAVTVVTPV